MLDQKRGFNQTEFGFEIFVLKNTFFTLNLHIFC